uniref:Uncharacterized protein n=1 Tax=Triticum urartu TaxID=4572 RepID=A0A8R7QTY4_TRIUA
MQELPDTRNHHRSSTAPSSAGNSSPEQSLLWGTNCYPARPPSGKFRGSMSPATAGRPQSAPMSLRT